LIVLRFLASLRVLSINIKRFKDQDVTRNPGINREAVYAGKVLAHPTGRLDTTNVSLFWDLKNTFV